MAARSSRSSSARATRHGRASMRAVPARRRCCSWAPCSAGRSRSSAGRRPKGTLDNPETKDGNGNRRPPEEPPMKLCMRLCAAILLAGTLAAADDQPWTLEASNWEKGKDLLPEPVVKRLQKGEYWFPVVSADPGKFHHNYSQAFWDATEKNAGKYDLDEKTCGLKDKATDKIPDFVFGLPFPAVDKADSKAGCKIAWNFNMAGAPGGGGGATFTLNGVDTG